ncbi:MAG: hypothetical protein N2170_03340 [Bacteroidia bacterium]|nr:hypothetical protein [Bacteroidia bacterium]
MFWHEEDGVDVEGLRQQFERQQREGKPGYYSQAELEHLLEWYLEHRRTDRARQVVDHAAYLYPWCSRVSFWRSRVAYEEGRFLEAYVHGMVAFREMEPSHELYEYLLEVCMAANRSEAAVRVLEAWWEQASTLDERSRAAAFLAEEYIARGQWRRAIPFLWRGWAVDERERLYFPFRLASAYRHAQLVEQGLYVFEERLWEQPMNVGLWLGLARLYLYKHAYVQAGQALHQVELLLQVREEEASAYWGALYRLWGMWYELHGKEAEAFRAWLQARHYQPHHIQVLSRLISYYQRWGEVEAAEPYLRRLYERAAHLPMARRQIADFLWAAGRAEESLVYYRSLLGRPSHRTFALGRLFSGYFRLRKARVLRRLLRYASLHFRDEPEAWLHWIREAYHAKQIGLAYLLAEHGLRIHQGRLSPSFYYWHAAVALRQGYVKRALYSLEQALIALPQGVSLFHELVGEGTPLPHSVDFLLKRYVKR